MGLGAGGGGGGLWLVGVTEVSPVYSSGENGGASAATPAPPSQGCPHYQWKYTRGHRISNLMVVVPVISIIVRSIISSRP
ncbi:hypothetical protein ACFLT3_01145 [Chloroflexota bacterium]